jgi:hypothetical protein|nr:MAG TPA: protein of unknown function (DUF4376) [Caudoviricetes sp.]DAU56926.1 MAG TPA: protein of unknown function (DUF4376) [Caudoviricetes sp.]
MVEELSNHNAAAKPGEELWTVKEQEDCYEVVSDGTVPSEEQSLEPIKNNKISESKTALSAYLASHPLQWSDGKYYSVTSEKQALLTSNLALYQISASAGQPFKLTWNSTGDECVEWTYEELAALALAIGTYVKPFVSRQQELEIAIKACTTMEELNAIEINYDPVLKQYLETAGQKEAAE